jgi:uncharacterized protein YbaR (Trm112 family)
VAESAIEARRDSLSEQLQLLCCPGCHGELELGDQRLACTACGHGFEIADGIPLLFWPNEWSESRDDVTEQVKAFYEETPFPNYDDFDSVDSLIRKARQGMFAKLLDDQVPPGTLIWDAGCGTGQLSNFLSIANRTVFGSDLCLNSLRLGERFRRENDLRRTRFLQMNLFRPAFKPGIFDLVIFGLYHRYGRLITDFRRLVFRSTGDRFTSLDPNLRRGGFNPAKRRAWMMDQYKHPHESKHTIGEVLGWFRRTGFRFVKSIPRSKPFRPFAGKESLFEPETPGNSFERLAVELGMIRSGSREGGFFLMVGRKDAAASGAPQDSTPQKRV